MMQDGLIILMLIAAVIAGAMIGFKFRDFFARQKEKDLERRVYDLKKKLGHAVRELPAWKQEYFQPVDLP